MKNKSLSSRQRRVSAFWMKHYSGLMAKPQRGFISYGGGLNILKWMSDAEAQGYHCTMTPSGVVLR